MVGADNIVRRKSTPMVSRKETRWGVEHTVHATASSDDDELRFTDLLRGPARTGAELSVLRAAMP